MNLLPKQRGFYLIAIFLFFLSVYIYTAPPSVYGGDSGEISAAIISLGLPHATGFPLYVLTAKVFTLLIRTEDMAYRLNIYSSTLTSLSLIFVFLTLKNFNFSNLTSLITTTIFGLGKTVWAHSGTVNAYALTLLFLTVLLFIYSVWMRSNQNKHLYLYSLVWGLSLGTHFLIITAVVPLIHMLWQEKFLKFVNFKKVGLLVLLMAMPLLQYIYVPIAYQRNSIVNLGQVSSVEGFINYVSQRNYSSKIVSRDMVQSLSFLYQSASLFINEFTIFFFIIILIGLYFLKKRGKSLFKVVLGIIILNILIMWAYGNNVDTSVLFRYFFISYTALTIPLAIGVNLILRRISDGRASLKYFLTILLLTVIIGEFFIGYKHNNKHSSFIVHDFADNALDSLEPNSILLSAGDTITGPIWYLQSIGKRLDVIVIDINLITLNWYIENENKKYPETVDIGLEKFDGESIQKERLISLIEHNLGKKKIYITNQPIDSELNSKFDFTSVGVVNRIENKNSSNVTELLSINKKNWDTYQMRNLENELNNPSPMIRQLVLIYSSALNNSGFIYLKNNYKDEAIKFFKKAMSTDPDNETIKTNLRYAESLH